MSLENAIQNLVEAVQENTETQKALIEAINAQGGEPAAPAKPAKEEKKPAAKAAPAKAEKAAPPAKGKAKPAKEEEEEDDGGFGGDEEEEEGEVTLDDVKVVLQRYAKAASKAEAMEVLGRYGVKNVDKLDEGDYAALVEEVEGLIAEL